MEKKSGVMLFPFILTKPIKLKAIKKDRDKLKEFGEENE